MQNNYNSLRQTNGKPQKPLPQRPPRVPRSLRQRERLDNSIEQSLVREAQLLKRVKNVKASGGLSKKDINPYIATLIDPENVHGVRFPDALPKATAAVRALINHNAYYFPDSTIEPAGTYFNVLSPVAINPLLEYKSEGVTTVFSTQTQEMQVLFGGCTRPDDYTGLFPVIEDAPSPATASDQMWLPQLTTMNFRNEWRWEDQDFAFPPFIGSDDVGVFYGCPMGLNVVAGTPGLLTVYVRTIQPAVAAVNPFIVTACASTGAPVPFTSAATLVGDTTFTFTLSATLLAGLANAGGYFPLPGLGFRIQNTTSRSYLIAGYSIGVITDQIGAGSFTRVQPRLVGIPCPDQKTYAERVDQYRVVSMSNWLEYDGSALNNGGQSASILYRAGQSAGESGLYNYQAVAQAPESYAGCLKEGTYTIWAPNSEADMLMRTLNSTERWKLPFITNAGVVSTPSQVNAVRLRVAINFELVSTAQLFDTLKPQPHPEWIDQASLLLREHPCTMANGKHWDWIKGVIRDSVDMVKGIGKWGAENKDWLIPAGTALASLLV